MYFQDIIMTLQKFWGDWGCTILQPYDMEVGAGTSSPATFLRALGPHDYYVAYVQPSRRPSDGRYGDNPNRLQHFYQFQAVLKPSPPDIQQLCLCSFEHLGIDCTVHDIRFVEDDWENPTLGASGLGWEVWCDGMEIFQYTYMQQLGGIECSPVPGEFTYGLERVAMVVQGVDNMLDIMWNKGVRYADVFLRNEMEYSSYNFEHADVAMLLRHFTDHEQECERLLMMNLVMPAYDQCLKACHIFNLLESRGTISVTDRVSYINRIRTLAKKCCQQWTAL